MRYRFIRDNKIFEYPEERLEVCDNMHEIVEFGIKEIENLLFDLKNEKFKDIDAIVDILELMDYLSEINFISKEEIENYRKKRESELGSYSKYLLKENV